MKNKNSIIMPILTGVLFGGVGVFVRILDQAGFDNTTNLSTRFIAATVILFSILLLFKRELLKIKWRDSWLFLGAGILGMLGLNLFYNEAIGRLSLSFAAILLSLAPFFVLFLAILIFKDKLYFSKISIMFVALIGCILASGAIGGDKTSFSSIGVFMGIGAAICYALYTIFSKLLNERHYSVYTILFYSLLVSSVMLVPLTDWSILTEYIESSPIQNTIFIVIYALCTSIFPYLFLTLSLAKTDSTTVATIVSGGEPIAALLFGLLLFAEIPTVTSLIGVVITILALTIYCKIES